MGSSSLKKVTGNSIWLILDKVGRIVIKLLVSILIANYLGSELLGTINYVNSITLILFSFASLGLNGIAVREMVEGANMQVEKVIFNSLLMKLLAAVLCFGISLTFVSFYLGDDALKLYAILLAAGQTFRSFEIFDYWFQSKLNSRVSVISRLVALSVVSLMQIAAIVFDMGILMIVLAMSTEFLLIAVLYVFSYLRTSTINFQVDFALWRSLLSKSWPLILSAFGSIIYLKVDQLMIEHYIDKAAVGVYGVAVQYSEIWYFLPNALALSFFPVLVKKKNEADFDKLIIGGYSLMFVLSLSIAIGVALLGPALIRLLYKEEFWQAGEILVIHIWAGIFIFMRSIFSKWLIISENYIHSLTTHLLGAAVNVALNLIFIPKFGIKGAAVTTLISYGFSSYFAFFLIPPLWKVAKQMTIS
ncbi:MAG: flippase, partial [Bacteroidota bacterium]